jgi:hypothetical protein
VKYIGGSASTPVDGWTLRLFADDWIGASDDDGFGPRIFRPSTVQATGSELAVMRASFGRFQTDPDTERRKTGRFWDLWTLHPDGVITPRALRGRRKR